MATERGTPAFSRFRTAVRRRSWKRASGTPRPFAGAPPGPVHLCDRAPVPMTWGMMHPRSRSIVRDGRNFRCVGNRGWFYSRAARIGGAGLGTWRAWPGYGQSQVQEEMNWRQKPIATIFIPDANLRFAVFTLGSRSRNAPKLPSSCTPTTGGVVAAIQAPYAPIATPPAPIALRTASTVSIIIRLGSSFTGQHKKTASRTRGFVRCWRPGRHGNSGCFSPVALRPRLSPSLL